MPSIQKILAPFQGPCPACGRDHSLSPCEIVIEKGALKKLPAILSSLGKRPFILADPRTWKAAGERAAGLLSEKGIPYSVHLLREDQVHPDEKTLGSALLYFDHACDLILAVGSGTINDLAKLCSKITGRPYVLLGTAPSMDGFASGSSSVIRDGLRVSLESAHPAAIVNDLDILKEAPAPMLRAGLGDMLAKYTSLCEWRIANLIIGEPYCPRIAGLIRQSLKACTDRARDLMDRDEEAVLAVTQGLVLCGLAMTMAGSTRPASGMEHYFSHIWDMRAQTFDSPSDLHGIQCGVAEAVCAEIFAYILDQEPDWERGAACADSFNKDNWKVDLRAFLGKSADAMIELEEKEHKYDPAAHKGRLAVIIEEWPRICQIIREEVPSPEYIRDILKQIGAPLTPQDLGHTSEEVRTTFYTTMDIRAKYIGSRLLWDMGLLEEAGKALFPDERPVAYFTEPGTPD